MAAPFDAQPIINFLPYQRRWLEDKSRFKIGMFARQTGKTFSTGGECVDDCFTSWRDDRRSRWVILSRGERQAAEMMTEVVKPFNKAFYEVYNTLLKACEGFLKISPPLAGVIRRDLKVREAIRNQTPILTRSPNCEAATDVEALVERLLRS